VSTILSVVPNIHVQGSAEKLPVEIDMIDLLDVGLGEVVGSPDTDLIDIATNVNYAAGLNGAPTVDGTVLTQSLHNLIAGHRYRLVVVFNASASKTFETVLEVEVPV
jgi:hypothetical protein